MDEIITSVDWVLLPVYLGLIFIFAAWYRNRLDDEKDKRYFTRGLLVKLLGGTAFALIYVYYYKGGDTFSYWISAKSIINLAGKDFNSFLHIMTGNMDSEFLSTFTRETGYPRHTDDPNAFATNVFLVPFVFLSGKLFLISTLVLDFFLYLPIFRFYMFLKKHTEGKSNIAAFSALFIPSAVFWSAGMLKDAFTFSFTLVAVVSIYNLLIRRKQFFRYLIYLVISAYIIISLKPYIFYAIIAASFIWLIIHQLRNIEGLAVKIVVMPLLVLMVFGGGIITFSRLNAVTGGSYSNVDSMVEKAYVTQQDLSSEYYGENTFDIGEFEPTVGGLLSKFPKAVLAGLFRPYPWDGNSALLIISALENFILMLLSLFVIIRIGPLRFFKYITENPFLIFCISFSVILAFFIGVTTGVFGALVRYRIPLLPFFVFMLLYMYEAKRKNKKAND